MKSGEIREIILTSQVGEQIRLVIKETEYAILRKEVEMARKFDYKIDYFSNSLGKDVRKVIFVKEKDGDIPAYKRRCRKE